LHRSIAAEEKRPEKVFESRETPQMPPNLCRWGILGTANIARKNWQAIRNAGNATLIALASRDRGRACRFIAECQADVPFPTVPIPCGSYHELLQRDDIDAVYLPVPTRHRKEWVLRAADAGKHVLCEKPCAVTSADLQDMLEACRRNRVQFMDGVMFMHSQRLALLRRTLDDPEAVGTIGRIASQFSFKGSEEFFSRNIRVQSDLEPLGCLGDLGWYNIRFSLWVLNEQLPERVAGRSLAQQGGGEGGTPVPTEFSGELFFPGDASASFYCSFRTENQQWAYVSGTQGYVHLVDFVLPFFGSEVAFEANAPIFRVTGCRFNMEDHARRLAVHEYSNNAANAQETRMIEAFAQIVISGHLEPRWPEQALKTQRVLDACLLSAREDGRIVSVR
jgi:predicted dehydrogenase